MTTVWISDENSAVYMMDSLPRLSSALYKQDQEALQFQCQIWQILVKETTWYRPKDYLLHMHVQTYVSLLSKLFLAHFQYTMTEKDLVVIKGGNESWLSFKELHNE